MFENIIRLVSYMTIIAWINNSDLDKTKII